jgi:protein SCO1/2
LTLKAGLVFIVTGAGIVFYFREERARLERKRIAEQTKGIGRPKVGGPFDLVDHNGKPFTDNDLKGKYSLVRYYVTVVVDAMMRQDEHNEFYLPVRYM